MISEINNNTPTGTRKQQMQAVAKQFEQVFTKMMLKSMRETVPENEMIPRSTGEKIYTDMLDSEYSNMMVNQSSIGLADVIVRQMMAKEGIEDDPTASALDVLQSQKKFDYLNSSPMHSSLMNSSFSSDFGGVSDIAADQTANLSQAFTPKIQRWDTIIDKASSTYNVPKNLIAAVISVESAGNPAAQSPVGAAGLMQLMPGTAKDLGVKNRLNPEENVLGGTKYLRQLLDRFDGNTKLALAAYNAGPGNVEKFKGVPPFTETQNYVQRITSLMSRTE